MGPKRTFVGDVKVATDNELKSKQRRRARESEQTRKVREAAEHREPRRRLALADCLGGERRGSLAEGQHRAQEMG
eukprot:1190114-Lingulodinium_polyedra.AAC.1